jgi:TP901 family phage tail tape measure protein
MSYNLGTAEGVITTSYNGKGVSEANKDVDKLTKGHKDAAEAVNKVGRASGIAGVAVAAGIGVAVNAAANFEQRMSAVKAVSGASAAEMDQLSKKALQLGKDTSFSATDAASAIEELVKAGVSVPDVMNGAADATVALAAAGEVSLPEAAAIASNAMNQFQLSAQDMPKVADLIAGAANASAIDVKEFGYSLSQAGAVANLVGASFDDTATAIALMGNAGIKGSDAGTSLKTMLSNLQPQTKKQTSLMEKLGIVTKEQGNRFFDAQGNLKSFAEIAEILQTSLKGATKAQQQQALETIFGSDAIRAAAIFTQAGAKGFDKMSASMNKVKAADVAKTRLDNFKGSLEQMKGSLETTGIVIGQLFLPYLRSLVDGIAKVVNAFLSLSPGVQKGIVIFVAIVGAILLFVAATVKIVRAVQTVIEVAKVLRLVMASTWVATLGPIALVIAAIALLVLGIRYAWKHSETFRTVVLAVWGAIKTAVSATLAWFTGTLWPGIQAVWNGIVSGLQAVGNFFVTIWNAIKTGVSAAIGFVSSVITTGMNVINAIISAVLGVVMGVWNAFWGVFGGVIKAAWNLIVQVVKLGIAMVQFTIASVLKVIEIVVRTVWGAISKFLTTIWNAIKSVASAVWNAIKAYFVGVFNTIKSITLTVWNAVRNAVIAAINAVKGPVMAAVNAVKSAVSTAWNAVKSVSVSIWNGLVSVVSGPINRVLSVVSSVVGKIRGVFAGAGKWLYNAGRDIIQGLLNGIESLINAVTGKLKWLTDHIPKVKGPEAKDKRLLRPSGRWIMEGFVDELDKGVNNALALLSNATGMLPDTITARSVTDVMPATGLARAAAVVSTGGLATPAGRVTNLNLEVYNPVGVPTSEELSTQATRMATLGVL